MVEQRRAARQRPHQWSPHAVALLGGSIVTEYVIRALCRPRLRVVMRSDRHLLLIGEESRER